MIDLRSDFLAVKELADALGRPRSYVEAMKRRGFRMPGGRATLAEAMAFLDRNPQPRARDRVTAVERAA